MTPLARIPARSYRQAMDWSLALISQGIEATIEQADDGWGLLVAVQEHDAAVSVIQQYIRENRGWPWRQPLPWPGLLFDWTSLVWATLVATFYWLSTSYDPGLRAAGIMDSSAVRSGEWWRLFTAVLLHADVAHLATNLSIGFVLLGLAMGRYGTGFGLLAAYLSGVGGNLLALWFYPEPHRSLGASGMVTGCLGLLAVQSIFLLRRHRKATRVFIAGVLGGLMLFVLLGLSPGTDVVAHLGGFATGLLAGGVLALLPNAILHSGKLSSVAAMTFGLLVLLSWWLALSSNTGG